MFNFQNNCFKFLSGLKIVSELKFKIGRLKMLYVDNIMQEHCLILLYIWINLKLSFANYFMEYLSILIMIENQQLHNV